MTSRQAFRTTSRIIHVWENTIERSVSPRKLTSSEVHTTTTIPKGALNQIQAVKSMTAQNIKFVRTKLLKARGFAYLRYLHLRNFIDAHASFLSTVGVCGSGLGSAELAVALEFPRIVFFLTDIVATGRPNYFKTMDLVMRWKVMNVRFGVWDLLNAPPARFDAVVSTEVLEHIKDAQVALRNQISAAKRFAYVLTPFATIEQNNSVDLRMAAFTAHQHYVCGFDADFFRNAGFESSELQGAYWRERGLKFRTKLKSLADAEIEAQYDDLLSEAALDLLDCVPLAGKCLAIKCVVRL